MVGMLLGEAILASLVVLSKPQINEINYIDTTETKYESIPVPVDSNLGTGIKISESGALKSTVGNNIVTSSSQRILYKYPKAVSAPIEVYGKYMRLDSGSSVSLSYETSDSKSKTYSEQVTSTINGSLSASIKIESGIGVFKEENSVTSTLGFEDSKTESIQDTYSSTQSSGININYHINEPGFYRLETRGMFDVYVVEYIIGVYDVKYVKGKPISSKLVYYTAKTTYVLSYINSSSSIGLMKYNWNDQNNIYELDKNYARKFFGSSTINFIE